MVERGRLPGGRGMARTAIGSELSVVVIILCMARTAGSGRAFEDDVNVALIALHINVCSSQFES